MISTRARLRRLRAASNAPAVTVRPKAPPPPSTPWKGMDAYVNADPTVLVGPDARVNLLLPPETPRIMLTIGEWSQVFGTFYFQRPDAAISVGKRCQLGASHYVATRGLTIGDDVIISWGCTLIDTDNHSPLWTVRRHDIHNYRKDYDAQGGKRVGLSHDWSQVDTRPIVIESKVWLGFEVIVLKGVTIGEGSVIGAGSVVAKDIPPWSIAAGNPCRVIKEVPLEGRE